MIIRTAIFMLCTLYIVYISRASLLQPRSHGFHRFFAWEAILALTLLNIDHWFVNPLSWHQLISWPLLIISLFLVIQGLRLLAQIGKPNALRQDTSLLGLEKTTHLVKTGIFHYIRHPMYSSLLFLAWGVFFKIPSWPGLLLTLLASAFLTSTAKIEETENIGFFGEQYRTYMQETKMFIPYIL